MAAHRIQRFSEKVLFGHVAKLFEPLYQIEKPRGESHRLTQIC